LPAIVLCPLFLILAVLWAGFPKWGMWPFLALESLVLLFIAGGLPRARAVVDSLRKDLSPLLENDEWDYLRKHALLFVWPWTARSLSGMMSFLSLLCVGVGIILLIRREWIGMAICVLNYFALASLARFLCPVQFVAEGYAKDPSVWAEEKRKLDSCIEFIQSLQETLSDDFPHKQKEDQ
jgi:hypothetical protein